MDRSVCWPASWAEPGDLFPKLGEEQMITFSSIADRFLHSLGYEVKQCASEEEARRFAAEMPVDSKVYPVYYFASDTTGEKGFEEFYVKGKKLIRNASIVGSD